MSPFAGNGEPFEWCDCEPGAACSCPTGDGSIVPPLDACPFECGCGDANHPGCDRCGKAAVDYRATLDYDVVFLCRDHLDGKVQT